MQKLVDWDALWKELVESFVGTRSDSVDGSSLPPDPWRAKAREFDARSKCKRDLNDTFRRFLASRIEGCESVLDIGAGTGRWTVLLARWARHVTAVEPSAAMREILLENLAEERITNVTVVDEPWPEANVEPHDFTLCAHAMYASPDLRSFVLRMMEVTRRSCFMLVKSPSPDGVMADACALVRGHRHDCPDFAVAYNVLLEMGLYPNVLMDPDMWDPWTSPSLETALAEVKRRLGQPEGSEYDHLLEGVLRRRLIPENGVYVWPPSMRSALVYWDVLS